MERETRLELATLSLEG